MLPQPRPWFVGIHHHLLCCRPALPFSLAPAEMVTAVAMVMGKSIFLPFLTCLWTHLDFLPRPCPPPPPSPPPLPPQPAVMIAVDCRCHCRRRCHPLLPLPSPTFLPLPILVDYYVCVATIAFVTTTTASVTITNVVVIVVVGSGIRKQGRLSIGRCRFPSTILCVLCKLII